MGHYLSPAPSAEEASRVPRIVGGAGEEGSGLFGSDRTKRHRLRLRAQGTADDSLVRLLAAD